MRGLYFYQNKTQWKELIKNAMDEDFSWERSAKEYLYVYQEGINKKENF